MNWYLEFVNAIQKNKAYDFICEHYWEMSKDELKDLLLECIYALGNGNDLDNVVGEIQSIYLED